MQKRMMAGLTSLIVFTVPQSSWSEGDGYYFDCDVPPAKVSVWHGPVDSAKVVRVSGTVQLLEARHDERWQPVASIFLKDAEGQAAGLQFYFNWRQADKLQVGLYLGKRTPFTQMPMGNSRVSFEFTVGPAGALAATVNDKSKTLGQGEFNAHRISLSCSSGQFMFEQILVEYE